MANRSAFLDGTGKPLRVGDSAIPTPGPDDIIVKNHAIAINPVDHMQANTGMMIQNWPMVLGSDIAGEVHDIGANVQRFKKGDRVAGMGQELMRGTAEDGAFSLYTRLPAVTAAVIPDKISFKDAAVLGMAIGTAVSGLNGEETLNLPFPSLNSKPTGKVIVVYGGSTSIGSMATQLATAAGVRVIAIAGSNNVNLCKKAGASEAFDYNDQDVVDDVVRAVGKDTFVGVFESISTEGSYKINLAILEKLGGGKMACSQPPPKDLPGNVHAKWMMAAGEHPAPVWENYVTSALESGRLKCLPEPSVVGNGLESLQKALETLQAGVSGLKIVVEL